MKGYIRIGGSLTLGIAVILGALYVRAHTDAQTSGGVAVVAGTPARTYIEATDSDSDGIKDWEESLQARVFESIATPTSTDASSTEPYVAPTTLTGKFSEAFIKGYLNEKMTKGDPNVNLTEEERAAFIQSAILAAEQTVTTKHYTPADILIVPTTPESLRAYGNNIMNTMVRNPVRDMNVLLILTKAIEEGDEDVLVEIGANEATYAKVISESLLVEVPEQIVETHLALLDSYEALRADLLGMQYAFDDTLLSIMHVRRYPEDNMKLLASLKKIKQTLSAASIYYEKKEPGSLFYSPEI